MKKSTIILFSVILLFSNIKVVYANVPEIVALETEAGGDGRVLTVTIRHSSPTSAHFVDKLEVKVGDATQEVELNPESVVQFTETVNIALVGDVQVRAHCTWHGWSSWATLGEVEANPSGGIPGFPILSIGIGLLVFTLACVLRHRTL